MGSLDDSISSGSVATQENDAKAGSQAPTMIALALSGGGVRAMAFHLGVLLFLAENRALERVSHVSTVSGGSLLVGLMLRQTDMQWPRSSTYESEVYQELRRQMCSRSLMGASIRQLLLPWNWIHLLSRAELVAKALRGWGVKSCLSDIPAVPEWSINGTTAENGRRFRFKRDSMGDWRLGYASARNFPLARAMAVSAAFPGGIGPLSISSGNYVWKRRPTWGIDVPEVEISLPFKRLRLCDGGVYDNLGLEPFYDAGKRAAKLPGVAIYVSDAGAPLAQGPSAGPLSPWRVKRLADIMSEQSRTLRVRSFISYLESSKQPLGAYAYIAAEADGTDPKVGNFARTFPTGLQRLKAKQFDAIAGFGYAVAKNVERLHGLLGQL